MTAGDLDRVDDARRKAIEMAPSEPWAHYNLGVLLQERGSLLDARLFALYSACFDQEDDP